MDLAMLAGQQVPKSSLVLSPQCWNYRYTPCSPPQAGLALSMDLNQDPQACTASVLPAEPSLQFQSVYKILAFITRKSAALCVLIC